MAIIDVIEHPNERSDEIVRRVPEIGSGEFKLGSQLIVRESQEAVFVRDGKALDVFGPGRYTLSTDNIPLLTGLIGIPFGGRTPFTAEVYFVSKRDFTNEKWGTPQALIYRDKELGVIRLRAYGTYTFRVADSQLFVNQIVGARGGYSTNQINEYLRSIILNEFNDILGSLNTSILDIQSMTGELAATTRAALNDDFARIGLELRSFQISAITPPEEVQQRIDERSGMAALGDMNTYMQYKTAQALGDAATTGGDAGAGVGLGAGMAMGAQIANAMSGSFGAGASAGAATKLCPTCNATVPANANFCPSCGHNFNPQPAICPKCGARNPAGSKFCTECGTSLAGS
jgi:membrane protease subunit (stomatin/prohibitin family)